MENYKRMNKFCIFAILYGFWISTNMPSSVTANQVSPVLNVSESFIDLKIETNATIYLKCSGQPPLSWTYIDPLFPDDESEGIPSITADHEITTNSYGNESIVRITFDSEEQTGKYICLNSKSNTSVYIFVDDGAKLLLMRGYVDFVHLYQGKSGVIPCISTVSKANVTLWKIEGPSKKNFELEYDPTKGFIVLNPNTSYAGNFWCSAEYEGRHSQTAYNVDFYAETESIPQVYIDYEDAKYVLVGSTFRLICVVQTEISAMFLVNWTLPVKDKKRVTIIERTSTSNMHRNMTKELIIKNATKSDEGIYQCNATDHSHKSNYAEAEIVIYEKPQESKVHFKSVIDNMTKIRGERAKLVAEYKVFPPSKDISEAFWMKNGKPLIRSAFEKYSTKTTEYAFTLEISNLSWKDSGLYTVTVNAPGGQSETSFWLLVEDKPVLSIQKNESCCYMPRKNYTILCESTGYPLTEISWIWSPYCLNSTSQCNPSYHPKIWETFKDYLIVNNSTVKVLNDGRKISSFLSVVAEESGFYKCRSENRFGATEKEITFIVSDAENGFEIIYETEYPEVNSYFSALCKASSLFYSNLVWKWIPDSNNESLIIQSNVPVNLSEYNSISLQLELSRITKNQTGEYICVAHSRNKRYAEEKSVYIKVVDPAVAAQTEPPSFMSKYGPYIVPSLVVIILFVLCLFKAATCITKRKSKMLRSDFDHQLFQEGRMALFDPNLPLDEQLDLLPYDEKWEFPKEKLKLGRTVGQGAFGRVVKAEAFGINDYEFSSIVAVKMLKERADSNQQKALMDELKILIHLGHHVNIVNLMGAVTKNIPRGELMVIVEFCRYGNIRHYLHRHRDSFIDEIDPESGRMVPVTSSIYDDTGFRQVFIGEPLRSSTSSSSGIFAVDNPSYRQTRVKNSVSTNPRGSTSSHTSHTGHTVVYSTSGSSGSSSGFRTYSRADSQEHIITTSDLLCYAFQCARGMEYLASRKLIHRDLAARNVLLADDKVVKICDFGLAKDCYKYSNYVKKGEGPLPIKWMSIESIWDHVFTSKSDVWAFGILMWEFFTLGGNPYPGIEIDEEFYKKLKAGYRMEKPEICPDFIYQIMRDCWHANPDERPNFSQISDMLGDYLEDGVKQHYIDLNESYMEMNRKMNVPDYSNVIKLEAEESQRIYVNSEINNDILAYDVPLGNRSVTNAPIPKEPMEVVPMIQLEAISDASSNVNLVKRNRDLLQITESYKPDYLSMGKTTEDVSNVNWSEA